MRVFYTSINDQIKLKHVMGKIMQVLILLVE